jgi:hypothetical protein
MPLQNDSHYSNFSCDEYLVWLCIHKRSRGGGGILSHFGQIKVQHINSENKWKHEPEN